MKITQETQHLGSGIGSNGHWHWYVRLHSSATRRDNSSDLGDRSPKDPILRPNTIATICCKTGGD